MSYKNYKWEVVGNEYNSPYMRNWLLTNSFFKYPELLGISRAVFGVASKNNQIEYLGDFSTWEKVHEELKTKVLENFKSFENLIDQSLEQGKKLNDWTEKNIFEKDLTKSTNTELIYLFKNFVDRQNIDAFGTALSIIDFSDFSFIEGNLNRFLKEKITKEKFQNYYSVFTEPENNSFAQDQEEDLLKLMHLYWDSREWRDDIKNKSLKDIENKYPDFYSNLFWHSKKHAWVYYVYMGPAFSEKDFFGFIVDFISKDITPQQKLNQLKERKKRTAKLKREYLRELNPTGLDNFVLKIAGKIVWAKSRRKDYQSKSYYHMEKLCREIAKRLFISLEQVRSSPFNIIEKALNGENVDWSITNNIKSLHICLPNDDGSITILVGKEAEEFSKNSIKRSGELQDLSDIKELRGSTACMGKTIGRVKIINLPEEMAKMEQGNILVSTATTPSIVIAMKKASAILTDEGGLTCHAAIVSRELNVPCVVGLKIATKFLKDGDIVEVNATKGTIKKLGLKKICMPSQF